MSSEKTGQVTAVRMPDGMHNVYCFGIFNALSFSMVLGLPMLLLLKRFGASATILGVANSMVSLLTILQIPAARYVEQVGYRNFVLRGWSMRSFFILLMATVAFLPSQIDATTKIVLLLVSLFFYNASRGFSSCGFLPWLTQLVPEEIRGRYISLDQMFGNAAIVAGSLAAAFYLKWQSGNTAFGVIFVVSFVTAMISLFFLRRIPDVPVPQSSKSGEPVPWGEIIRYKPFQRLLIFNAVILTAWAGGGVFGVPMLRDQFGLTDTGFLILQSVYGLFFIASVLILGNVLDKVGSLPLLNVSVAVQTSTMAGWGLITSHLLPFCWWSVGFEYASWGLAVALFSLSNTRLVMAVVPAMGRTHFFAVFSVTQSMVLGLCPVMWGFWVDVFKPYHFEIGPWHGNVFSFSYPLLAVIMLLSYIALRKVHEPKALTMEEFFHELLAKTPARAISRLLGRRIGM